MIKDINLLPLKDFNSTVCMKNYYFISLFSLLNNSMYNNEYNIDVDIDNYYQVIIGILPNSNTINNTLVLLEIAD